MTNTNSCISQKQSGIGRTNESHRQFSMTYDCFNPVFIEWKATGLVSTFFLWFRWHDFPSQDCIVLSFYLQLRLCRKWKRALEVFDVKLFLRDFFPRASENLKDYNYGNLYLARKHSQVTALKQDWFFTLRQTVVGGWKRLQTPKDVKLRRKT